MDVVLDMPEVPVMTYSLMFSHKQDDFQLCCSSICNATQIKEDTLIYEKRDMQTIMDLFSTEDQKNKVTSFPLGKFSAPCFEID